MQEKSDERRRMERNARQPFTVKTKMKVYWHFQSLIRDINVRYTEIFFQVLYRHHVFFIFFMDIVSYSSMCCLKIAPYGCYVTTPANKLVEMFHRFHSLLVCQPCEMNERTEACTVLKLECAQTLSWCRVVEKSCLHTAFFKMGAWQSQQSQHARKCTSQPVLCYNISNYSAPYMYEIMLSYLIYLPLCLNSPLLSPYLVPPKAGWAES